MKLKSKFGWLDLIVGIASILLGIYTFANPGTAFSGFVIAYGILAIIGGIVDIVFYARLSKRIGFGPVLALLGGIFGILAGILILCNPTAGSWVLSFLFPIWFISHCISNLANLSIIRFTSGKAAFYVSLVINILALLLGCVLLFNPLASAISMTYLIGLYLIVIGLGNIVMAFSRPNEI